MVRLGRHRWLHLLLAGALLTSAYVFVPAVVPRLLDRAEAEPVSGAFALGGGLGGQVDPRTGQFSVSMPLVNVPSRGTSGVTMTLSWDQARAGAAVDRYGWGAGWSLGTTFVAPEGGITVYPANGGSYAYDNQQEFASGMVNYLLRDLTFVVTDGSPNACDPASPDASYLLAYDDGRTDCFDANGNFVARIDRFGNRTELSYTQVGPGRWQPSTITDAYGLVTTFTYADDADGNPTVTVSAPKRSDGITASTVVTFDGQNRVQTVTDPTGASAQFFYSAVPGGTAQYLTSVVGPSLARTTVKYRQIAYPGAPPLIAVDTLDVADADGDQLSPTRTFSMDPPGNLKHNFAGYPKYANPSRDELFASADRAYEYSTRISNGQTSTLSTYDAAHRLVSRKISAGTDAGDVVLQQHALTYPPLAVPQALSPNYARPLTSAVSFFASSGPGGLQSAVASSPRTVTTSTQYDDHGRIQQATDETGAVTKTSYDPAFGLVTSSVTTGADGTKRSVTNTLTADNKSIHTTSQAEAKSGGTLSARTVTSYGYDQYGTPNSKTVTWADGAAPPGNGGGPASTITTYTGPPADTTARTRTIVVTVGADTPAARPVTTVLDLVSGQPIRTVDALNRITTRTYDAGGRIRTVTPPTGLTTKTSYGAADANGPASRTVTEADGHVTVTSYDPLGQVATVTDNVRNGAFVTDPTVRTVATTTRSPDGTTLTATDRAGRTTTTTNDPLGRPVREVGPTGVTKNTTYNDVANSVATAVVGDNAKGASQTTTASYDALNREVASRTTYPVPNSSRPLFLVDPLTLTSFDGIGRKGSMTANDLTAVPDYAGAGGVPVSTVVSPTRSARAPGDPITATEVGMLDGTPTSKTLQQPGQTARTGSTVSYDAAGNFASITDPLGKITSYTYTADGRPDTRTSPSGTVTKNSYDPVTGRITTVTSRAANGDTSTTSYGYVPAGAVGAGLVKTLTNESGTLTYSYDADRNPVSVKYPDGTTISSDFADNGELLTSTDATGAVTTYAYYDDSSLKSATQVRAGVTLASVSYTYDGLSRIQTTTRGNGLVTTNTYTPNNLLDTQTTVNKAGATVETHDYDYDSHHNLVRQVDTTAPLASCRTGCGANPASAGTYTTTYGYDAYNRLTGSAVYAGAAAVGTPITKIGYRLDASGNVTTTTRTTTPAGQPATTTVTDDAVDDAGQLTSRTVGGQTTKQAFDPDGRVLTSLAGASTSYRPDGLPATVAKGGATTTYSYWADGSRRTATTTAPGAGTSSVTLYYRADGTLVNDTTAQGTGTGSSATASYLLTAGREARTLRSATTAMTTGTGVGYFLRDRHNSVTALVDSGGAVTNTYSYADYGAPALLDGRPGSVAGSAAAGVGRTNPFTYVGAAAQGMFADAAFGTFMTPARVYDPTQARFTSRDSANVHNRYAAFDTNPIMKVDPTGQSPLVDFFVDLLFTLVFVVATVETGGAAAALGAEAYAGIEAAEAVAEGASAALLAQGVATAANVVGAVSYGTRLADDVDNALSGKHFLSEDQRNDLNNVGTLAGGIAGVGGLVAAGATAASSAAAAADEATDLNKVWASTTKQVDRAEVRPDVSVADPESSSDTGDISWFPPLTEDESNGYIQGLGRDGGGGGGDDISAYSARPRGRDAGGPLLTYKELPQVNDDLGQDVLEGRSRAESRASDSARSRSGSFSGLDDERDPIIGGDPNLAASEQSQLSIEPAHELPPVPSRVGRPPLSADPAPALDDPPPVSSPGEVLRSDLKLIDE